jgi:hypothetical protein
MAVRSEHLLGGGAYVRSSRIAAAVRSAALIHGDREPRADDTEATSTLWIHGRRR